MANSLDEELERYCNLIDVSLSFGGSGCGSAAQDTQTTPLFTTDVCSAIKNRDAGQQALGRLAEAFPQYGLLGLRQGTYNQDGHTHATPDTKDNLIFANMNAPWSAFICGSQGGGKSHSLSCLLENCLLPDPRLGVLPNPLAGLVFHYDEFTSITTTQLCEAAYLCSSGIPVRVLVSPSNYHNMARLYSNLPGLPPDVPRPRVMPLYLQETQLNKENIKTLMAVNDTSSSTPLYVAVLFQILRSMSDERPGKAGIDYADFRRRLDAARFTRDQSGPLNLRLQLLESFLDPRITGGKPTTVIPSCDIWDFEPGTLTIVDLSDPFVNENDACALFSISLTLFMESRGQAGRVVALDEAHKFLTQSGEALRFTTQLVSLIKQQRHLATRVLMATQEPTLSTDLIDLCDITIVHRFRSPAWYETLKNHLAGARLKSVNESDIFQTIISLETGEALLFSPTARLDVGVEAGSTKDGSTKDRSKEDESTKDETKSLQQPIPKQLKDSYIKIRIRKRITTDGGKSIMASDAGPAPNENPHSGSQASSPASTSICFTVPAENAHPQTSPKAPNSSPHEKQQPALHLAKQVPKQPQPKKKKENSNPATDVPNPPQSQHQLNKQKGKATNQAHHVPNHPQSSSRTQKTRI